MKPIIAGQLRTFVVLTGHLDVAVGVASGEAVLPAMACSLAQNSCSTSAGSDLFARNCRLDVIDEIDLPWMSGLRIIDAPAHS